MIMSIVSGLFNKVIRQNRQEKEMLEQIIQIKAKEYKKLKNELEIWKNQVLVIDGEDITVQITEEQFNEYCLLKRKCEKYYNTIGEVENLTKGLFVEQPPCVDEPDCPYNGGAGFDNHCNKFCQMIIGKRILKVINKMREEK